MEHAETLAFALARLVERLDRDTRADLAAWAEVQVARVALRAHAASAPDAGSPTTKRPRFSDAQRYRAFFDAGLPITFLGVEHRSKRELDAAIDFHLKGLS